MFVTNLLSVSLIVIGNIIMAIGINKELDSNDTAIIAVGYLIILLGIIHLFDHNNRA